MTFDNFKLKSVHSLKFYNIETGEVIVEWDFKEGKNIQKPCEELEEGAIMGMVLKKVKLKKLMNEEYSGNVMTEILVDVAKGYYSTNQMTTRKIIRNQQAVILVIERGDGTTFKSVAKCHPEDEFDFYKGVYIAWLKAIVRETEREIKRL